MSALKKLTSRAMAVVLLASGAVCALGTANASADTALGNQVAAVAYANLGKTDCSDNSTGEGGVPNAAVGFGTSCSGEEWCADFAKWVWNQAGYSDTDDIGSAAYTFARHGAAKGTFHWIYDTGYTPQPGDAVVWMGNDVTLSTTKPSELDFNDVQHVDLVYSVASRTSITTIGGNERSKVSEMTFNPTNSVINGGTGQDWGQSVIGYISPGASISTPPTGFNVTLDANGAPLTAGESLTGTVDFTAMASAQGYIYGLDYTITGPGYSTTINGGTGAANYVRSWDTAGLADGTYTIKATAYETDGQAHVYGPISFAVKGNSVNPISIAGMADGSAQIAVIGADGLLYHEVRDVNGNWSGLQAVANDHGGAMQAKEAAISGTPDGSAQLLVEGTDGLLYWGARNPNGTWTGWSALPSISGSPMQVKALAITGMHDGSSQIAVIGNDNVLYHEIRDVNGNWSGLQAVQDDHGGAMRAKSVAISGTPDGSAQLLVEGTDGLLYWGARNPNGTWTGWSAIPSISGSPMQVKALAITGMHDGSSQIAVIGNDNVLYHEIRDVNGNWSGLQAVANDNGGAMQAKSAAISGTPDGSAQLLAEGTDGILYHEARYTNGTWTGFSWLAGINGQPMHIGS